MEVHSMPMGADKSFDNFDFLDFAQEFLRRNANYQAQFITLSKVYDRQYDALHFRMMAQSWGLEFRLSAHIFATR
jgi:Family of unknown function (DUF6499)